MKFCSSLLLMFMLVLVGGCSEMGTMGGPRYGETSSTPARQSDRYGTITRLERVKVDDSYKLGVGTAVGAVAGGILGSEIGDSTGATVAGAVLGGLAGTYGESKLVKKNAQKITVGMDTGGRVTILQPENSRLREGMKVWIEGSGENARVLPR